MNIILGKEVADQLRERYTVLELETFSFGGKETIAYCVLEPESIVLTEMPDLERLCRLHQGLIDAWNEPNHEKVMEIMAHLRGRFSGELDSFYDVLAARIQGTVNDN